MYRSYISTLSKKIDAYFSMIDAHHNYELGAEFEIALCKILNDVLGDKFGVCKGYIVTPTGEIFGDDIIIFDRLKFATMRMLGKDNFAQKENVPIEAVYAYIEAKHNLEFDNQTDLCEKKSRSFKKALKQIKDIRSLKRPSRPINKITEQFSADSCHFKINVPEHYPNELNPLYTCIISRKTTYRGKDLNSTDTLKILEKQSFLKNGTAPDLIIAGDKTIVIASYSLDNAGNRILAPFLTEKDKSIFSLHNTKYHALATGLIHLTWALSKIELGSMPLEEIILDSLVIDSKE